MYNYQYDKETGGIVLLPQTLEMSKEPRPVYASELNILGLNDYWNYENQDDSPYMWAEANAYYYRGKLVAKTKGGNLYERPELLFADVRGEKYEKPEPTGESLRTIDLETMNAKNREMLTVIEQFTVKKIFEIFKKYERKIDIFHVAFSGGKDSIVLLELVKRALPKDKFIVVFGDTGMEFPDTYNVIDKIETQCKEESIEFLRAKSHLDAKESWRLFGAPAQSLRWCCSVHKAAPQTLAIRNFLGKHNYIGLDFVGVRAQESLARSEYEYENYGKKQKGQYSHNPILEWTSAEVWAYIFANNLIVNKAYKVGCSRAGCLFCPMSNGKSDYFRFANYEKEISDYIEIIKDTNGRDEGNQKGLISYVANSGWCSRKNGRDIKNNLSRCNYKTEDGQFILSVIDPKTDWKEWIKTIGDIVEMDDGFFVRYDEKTFNFKIKNNKNGYTIYIAEYLLKNNPAFGKIFRQVFYKAAYCCGCKVCETNCKNNCIKFINGLKVNCVHCKDKDCHEIDSGCLIFNSLRLPQGEGKKMKSLNSFADHAPKNDWLIEFWDKRENFIENTTLRSMKLQMFRKFLRTANLIENNQYSRFAETIYNIGWDSEKAQGLILANLAYNPQFEWYIKNLEVSIEYPRKRVEEMLAIENVSPKDAKSIIKAFARFVKTPLGTILNFGKFDGKDEGEEIKVTSITRTPCATPDNRVFLYSLYKFAENANSYYEFTLSRLMNYSVDSDGLSPTLIFSVEKETAEKILVGLSARYPDFISASFTHDLDKITIYPEKKSEDVLMLF